MVLVDDSEFTEICYIRMPNLLRAGFRVCAIGRLHTACNDAPFNVTQSRN